MSSSTVEVRLSHLENRIRRYVENEHTRTWFTARHFCSELGDGLQASQVNRALYNLEKMGLASKVRDNAGYIAWRFHFDGPVLAFTTTQTPRTLYEPTTPQQPTMDSKDETTRQELRHVHIIFYEAWDLLKRKTRDAADVQNLQNLLNDMNCELQTIAAKFVK